MASSIRTAGREIRLVCLDLDDTIIDTERAAPGRISDAIFAAQALLSPALSPTIAAALAAEVLATDPISPGRFPVLLRGLGLDATDERAATIRAAYDARLVELLQLFDGATETIARLRARFTVAIVTNGPVALQEAKLGRFGLAEQVDHVVISDALGFRKPDPRIFQHVCALAGVPPAHAVHAGDSLVTDVAGARAAGLASVWVHAGGVSGVHGEAEPDAVVSAISELAALLLD